MARVSEAEREERIARCAELVQQGLTHREIAESLGVSLPTVSNYIRVAKERGLLGEDERESEGGEFLSDFRALVENAPAIESLASHIDFSRSPREVLKQVEDIKELYRDELDALGFLALILRSDTEERERQLKALGIDVDAVNQLRTRFANILRYVRALYVKDHIGVENEWHRIRARNLFNLSRDELLIELEIHTDLETFKTRDRLDSLLNLVAKLLFHCGETIREISVNGLHIDSDQLKRCKENLLAIGEMTEKALKDLEIGEAEQHGESR